MVDRERVRPPVDLCLFLSHLLALLLVGYSQLSIVFNYVVNCCLDSRVDFARLKEVLEVCHEVNAQMHPLLKLLVELEVLFFLFDCGVRRLAFLFGFRPF